VRKVAATGSGSAERATKNRNILIWELSNAHVQLLQDETKGILL
jgi:hypothetical protein